MVQQMNSTLTSFNNKHLADDLNFDSAAHMPKTAKAVNLEKNIDNLRRMS